MCDICPGLAARSVGPPFAATRPDSANASRDPTRRDAGTSSSLSTLCYCCGNVKIMVPVTM